MKQKKERKEKKRRGGATCLDERVDVQHEGLRPADDELIDAGDGVGPATQQTPPPPPRELRK